MALFPSTSSMDTHTMAPIHAIPPPLHLTPSMRHPLVNSAPTTSYPDGTGTNGWLSYTLPGTGASAATSASAAMSNGSPVFPALLRAGLHCLKGDGTADDSFYHHTTDMDQLQCPCCGTVCSIECCGLSSQSCSDTFQLYA
jgi:hypothetical protein